MTLQSSNLPLVFRNSLAKIVTSLPFVDKEATPKDKQLVDKHILLEMNNMERINYLQEIPELKLEVINSPAFLARIQEIKNKTNTFNADPTFRLKELV